MYEELPEDEIFKVVEQMPLFHTETCGQIEDYEERKLCADRAMLDYLYRRVTYPSDARKTEKEGLAAVSFVVETDGTMSDIPLVRDPESGLGQAALAAVTQMQADGARWEAGVQKGRTVRVQFILPIMFRLAKEES